MDDKLPNSLYSTESHIGCNTKFPLAFISTFWRGVFVIVWPCLCSFIFMLENTVPYRCLYVVFLMSGYWITKVIPVAVTALLPILLFPPMGILDTNNVCSCYINNVSVLFMGGLILAVAIECSNLHSRLALLVLLFIGCNSRRLHFGMTFITMFFSMWISNMAATALMCPIIVAVLNELEMNGIGRMYAGKEDEISSEAEPRPSDFTNCYFLAITYAASIGSIGTLLGSGVNMAFKGIYEMKHGAIDDEVSFAKWMLCNVPIMLLMTLLTWIWLQILYMGLFRSNSDAGIILRLEKSKRLIAHSVIRAKYYALGGLTWHEVSVAILFVATILLLSLRRTFVVSWFEQVKDVTIVIATVIIMFIIPKKFLCLKICCNPGRIQFRGYKSGLLSWNSVHAKVQWGLIFLLGGGFALTEGIVQVKLYNIFEEYLGVLEDLPPYSIVIIVSVIAAILTEVSSNIAVANIILPLISELSSGVAENPFISMFIPTLCCSFPFLLPIGSYSNTMVQNVGGIRTNEMIKAGFGVKIICLFCVLGLMPLWNPIIFGRTVEIDTVAGRQIQEIEPFYLMT